MATTTNLAVTKIDSAQAQKEVTANEAFDVFDAALSELSIAMTDANYTLSTSTVPQEWQYGVIKFTGTLTAGRNIIVPTNKKQYTIYNNTTGGFAITVKTSGGTGVAVSATKTAILRCDGTNVEAITPGAGVGSGTVTSVGVSSTDLSVSGSPVTSSGSITLNINNDAVTYAKMQNVSATSRLLGRVTSGAGDVEEIVLDTDTSLTSNSDSRVATQKAVKAYADSLIAANDAMIFMGSTDCSSNPNYPAADRGHTYRVSVAGKIGGASGVNVEVGDMFICLTDGTSSGTQAGVGSNWSVIQTNLDGAVIGPASVTDSRVCLFDGTTGKLIKEATVTAVLDQISSTRGTILYRGSSSWSALAVGTDGQVLTTHDSGADPTWVSQPCCAAFFYPGVPAASACVMEFVAPAGITAITFASSLTGSSGKALTAATAQTDFDVRKNATTSANGTSVGTIRFAASGTVPTFIAASGFTLTGGSDWLTVWGPATPDATLANIGVTLYATR